MSTVEKIAAIQGEINGNVQQAMAHEAEAKRLRDLATRLAGKFDAYQEILADEEAARKSVGSPVQVIDVTPDPVTEGLHVVES